MAGPLEKRASGFVDRVRRLVALWRYGSRESVLALMGFISFAAASGLALGLGRLKSVLGLAIPEPLKSWLEVPLWLAGFGCLGLATLRIYRRVTAPLPQGDTKLPALKGAASFTPDDAELFAQLGRGADLEQLRAWILDDQTPLVVLMGESGVGKTSLLRAGLTHALKKDGVEVSYWEALPTDSAAGLLYAVRTAWGKAKGSPGDLAALPAAIAGSYRVVVLDQFEQLSPEAHPELFDLLKDVLQTPPPYRGTWIVAFRREYAATWLDFTLALPEPVRRRVETSSLNRFSLSAARRVAAVLAVAAELPVDQGVVDALVDGIAIDRRVSPVDLGVTLLGLEELAGLDGTPGVSLGEFRTRGGSTGLLTRYLERVLTLFSPAERNELLVAMLALVDLNRNQRLAEGLAVAELVAKVRPVSAARFDQALQFLASGKARVLEVPTDPAGAVRYRLVHERFIEPLRVLSGKISAEVEQAALRLDDGYRDWSRDRRRRHLLSGSELRLVLRYQEHLRWGDEEPAKREYLRRSRRRRTVLRALAAASCLGLVGLLAATRNWRNQQEMTLELRSVSLPDDLWKYVDQLETLEVDTEVKQIDWLLRASRLRSLTLRAELHAPASLPPELDELTCDRCSGVELLVLPSRLRRLTLRDVTGNRLPSLPASLRALDLPEYNPTLKTPPISFQPSDLPRGLTSLSAQIARDSSLAGLPSLLKSLTLEGPGFIVPQYPSGLIELKLQNALDLPQALGLRWVPRNVTSLTLELVPPLFNYEGAPPGLSSLTVIYADTGTDKPSTLDLRGLLPHGLATLAIRDKGNSSSSPVKLDLRDLDRLTDLDLRETPCSDVRLPNGLKSLEASSLLPFLHLPAGIKQMRLVDDELSDLKRLPRALKSLQLADVRLQSWEGLPPHLQSLSLIGVRAPLGLELPQDLDSLEIADTPLALGTLPPHLVSLTIDGPLQTIAGRLPATLRSLNISQTKEALERLDDPLGLPRLKELTLPRSVKSLRGLPKSVRVLRLK